MTRKAATIHPCPIVNARQMVMKTAVAAGEIENLEAISSPRLRNRQNPADVDDCVRNYELQYAAHDSSDGRCHDNDSGRSNVNVTGFLGKMERGIVSRHGPDDRDGEHESSDAMLPICTIPNSPPHARRFVEFGIINLRCRNNDGDDEKKDDVCDCPDRVESSNR